VCPGNRWNWVVFGYVLVNASWVSFWIKSWEQAKASHRNNHGKNGLWIASFPFLNPRLGPVDVLQQNAAVVWRLGPSL
ncbi:hypothetical protein EDD17DRAFT_1892966, partial [Pisolithus thermaeus]